MNNFGKKIEDYSLTEYYPFGIYNNLINKIKNSQEDSGNWCLTSINKKSHISPWTTAEALFALHCSNTPPNKLNSAIDLILNNSVILKNNTITGWHYRKLESEGIGIGITADCIKTLILYDKTEKIMKSIEKLLQLQKQEANSQYTGWGFTENSDIIYTTPTCLVIQALLVVKKYIKDSSFDLNTCIHNAVLWLIGAQHSKGGWGTKKGIEANSSNTALTIYTLFECLEDPILKQNHSFIAPAVSSAFNILEELSRLYKISGNSYKYWGGYLEVYREKNFRGLGSPLVLLAYFNGLDKGLFENITETQIPSILRFLYKNISNDWVKNPEREPTIFDNAYWLVALKRLQKYYLKINQFLFNYFVILEKEKPKELIKIIKNKSRKSIIYFSLTMFFSTLFSFFLDLFLNAKYGISGGTLWAIIGIQISLFLTGISIYFAPIIKQTFITRNNDEN